MQLQLQLTRAIGQRGTYSAFRDQPGAFVYAPVLHDTHPLLPAESRQVQTVRSAGGLMQRKSTRSCMAEQLA